MEENIRKLKELIDGSDNIVFFGGAGVSTESGIPDFRSVDGLYNQKYKYPPDEAKGALETVMRQCELWVDTSPYEPFDETAERDVLGVVMSDVHQR